jgi:hypothetical protein
LLAGLLIAAALTTLLAALILLTHRPSPWFLPNVWS